MNKALTIFLAVAALAALGYLFFIAPLIQGSGEDIVLQEGRIPSLDPAKVRVVRIRSGDQVLEMQRKGLAWQLGTKSKDRADKAVMEQLLRTFSELSYLDRIPAKALSGEDLKTFGLKSPKREITLEGDETLTLFLGNDAAVEGRVYLQSSNSDDVYLVNDEAIEGAFRSAAEFRDRRLTDLQPEGIDRIIIRRDAGEIELVRDVSGWQITKPLHTRADAEKVEEYLGKVLGLRILEYVDEDTGDLSVHGLAEGRNEISFFAGGNARPQTLRLGQMDEKGLLGQFTARDSIYRLPAATTELLEVQPDALRDRRLIVLNPDVVDQIRISSPEGKITLKRNGSGWEFQEGDSVQTASLEAVHSLWNTLADAEAEAYLPVADLELGAYGLETPLCTVEYISVLSENTPESRAGEQVLAAIDFGRDPEGAVFARLSQSPEIASIPATVLEAIPLQPANWRAPEQ